MFITLEGIEGAGKTTQIKNVIAFLQARGYDCVTTREPGGTRLGSRIREILLDPGSRDLASETELLLYVADRIQHIRAFIEPQQAAGRTVVCDRFFDATLVYQGYARGVDKTLIRQLHQLVCGGLTPDLTLLFDLNPEVGLRRALGQLDCGARPVQESRFEKEAMTFHQKVRAGYLELAAGEPGRFRVIDAGKPREEVAADLEKALADFLASTV